MVETKGSQLREWNNMIVRVRIGKDGKPIRENYSLVANLAILKKYSKKLNRAPKKNS